MVSARRHDVAQARSDRLLAPAWLGLGEHQAQYDADAEERREKGEGVGRDPDGESGEAADQHPCGKREWSKLLLAVVAGHRASRWLGLDFSM
jgi:hypothetical protein